MLKKVLCVMIISVFLLISSGCASLNGNVPFQYQPSLTSFAKKIKRVVGLNMLRDRRPEKDRAYTKGIKDLPEKVTSKMLDDFRYSNMFTEIHFPAQKEDDLVINGTINRFKWKMYAMPIAYIPYVNFIMFFGLPATEAYGIVDIHLQVKDNQSGAILGSFKESSEVKSTYTIYNTKAGEAGAELAEAFRDVVKKLKQDIMNIGRRRKR